MEAKPTETTERGLAVLHDRDHERDHAKCELCEGPISHPDKLCWDCARAVYYSVPKHER